MGVHLLLSLGPFIQLVCYHILMSFLSIYKKSYFHESDCLTFKCFHNFEYLTLEYLFSHFCSIRQMCMNLPTMSHTMLSLGETLGCLHQNIWVRCPEVVYIPFSQFVT